MQDIDFNEAIATMRRVASLMNPAVGDTAVVRGAKVGFRISALIMLATVTVVAVSQSAPPVALS
ncbi:hypothetical protein [Microbacterium sp. 10M-3C3]|jgi:hypothetical protein|uniref:hypothetical protein n=1 Tax=Microbacterium sp. 10M-3C3 TaxID=2483401 RepID=UPI000F639C3D|nr:hypothetical protein [Microbacterium sp. 10M-3C3]